jgi:hypothetical protein
MTEPTLAQRFQRLEDIEAIKDLTARYATAVNKGWNGKTLDLEAIPSIFATDARWKSRDMGIATEGLDAVVAGLPESIAACSSPQRARLALRRRCDAALKPWLIRPRFAATIPEPGAPPRRAPTPRRSSAACPDGPDARRRSAWRCAAKSTAPRCDPHRR